MPSYMIIMFISIVWHQGLPPDIIILNPKTMKQCELMQSSFIKAAAFEKEYNGIGPTVVIEYSAKCEKFMSGGPKV